MTDHIQEVLDRTRRIETRLTRFMTEQGFDPRGEQPIYHPDERLLTVPSRKIAMQECLEAIPPGVLVTVTCGGEEIAQVERW
jgi:hypothetical protein